MEVELFTAIKDRIESLNLGFNMIRIWNNQIDKSRETDEDGNLLYSINYPALFVEFGAPYEIQQLGFGVQVYDPLLVMIHIAHNEIDSMDGNMDQNVNVFALKQEVFKALQGFEPDHSTAFIRQSEVPDYDHPNLYHYIQTYSTTYVDNTMEEPVNGVLSPEDVTLELSADFDVDLSEEL